MTRSHRLGRLVRRRLEPAPTVRQTMKASLYKIDHRRRPVTPPAADFTVRTVEDRSQSSRRARAQHGLLGHPFCASPPPDIRKTSGAKSCRRTRPRALISSIESADIAARVINTPTAHPTGTTESEPQQTSLVPLFSTPGRSKSSSMFKHRKATLLGLSSNNPTATPSRTSIAYFRQQRISFPRQSGKCRFKRNR
jgi:hypothetical protein